MARALPGGAAAGGSLGGAGDGSAIAVQSPVPGVSAHGRRGSRIQGANTSTLGWLGTRRRPGQFVEFWRAMLVMRVSGAPPHITVNAAVRCRDGPITVADATPIA